MKRWIIGFVSCFFLLVLSVFVFVPNHISFSGGKHVSAPSSGLYRNLVNKDGWQKWWPGHYKKNNTDSMKKKFLLNNYSYTIDDIQVTSLTILIAKNNFEIKTYLHILPDESNTTKLLWEGVVATSFNPIKRFQISRNAREISNEINKILGKMQSYFSKAENVYGINILKEHVVDSIFIFKSATSKGFPNTGFIYSLINDLKTYTKNNSAHETGFPMLNINTDDSINYLVKVAIPVDKRLPASGNISHKWMPGGGNILAVEVKGDYTSINKAFSQLKNYVDDNHYVVPAIPFQSLIKDRSKETDSSTWITRLYYPVMYY